MSKSKLLIIGKIPPPMGGVTIHVSRLLDNLSLEGFDYRFEVLNISNFFNLTKSFIFHKNIHLHASNPYVHFVITFFARITCKTLILTLHAEFGQHKNILKNIFEFISLRFASIPIVLNSKSFTLVHKINKNVILDSAYIKPVYESNLPIELEQYLNQKRLIFEKIFCTNAYNRVYDLNGNELYGIDELIKLFEKTNFLLIVCDPSGNYTKFYKKEKINNTFFIDYAIDFISLLTKTDGFIRNTTTDGDSISIHEAIFNNVPVFCTSVVDRPINTIIYENAENDLFKLLNSNHNLISNIDTNKKSIIFNIYKTLK
jgi:hypothetical protein